jgi:hypothetical protein
MKMEIKSMPRSPMILPQFERAKLSPGRKSHLFSFFGQWVAAIAREVEFWGDSFVSLPHDDGPLVVGSTGVCRCMQGHESA